MLVSKAGEGREGAQLTSVNLSERTKPSQGRTRTFTVVAKKML